MIVKDTQHRHWTIRVAILAPYAWLVGFFLLPFLIVLKISLSQTAIGPGATGACATRRRMPSRSTITKDG